ncbi:hypothetical protein YC2023_064986 [Brassica napus]
MGHIESENWKITIFGLEKLLTWLHNDSYWSIKFDDVEKAHKSNNEMIETARDRKLVQLWSMVAETLADGDVEGNER